MAPGESTRWQRHGADHHYGRSKDGALGGGPGGALFEWRVSGVSMDVLRMFSGFQWISMDV